METYNRTERKRKAVAELERQVEALGNDEGFIEVSRQEYNYLLEHYEVEKAPWWKFQGWPKIKGVIVIPMAPLRKI